jgi:hypothetical protein
LKLLILILSLQALPLTVFADYQLLVFERGNVEAVFSCWLTEKPILSFNHADSTMIVKVPTRSDSLSVSFSKMVIKLRDNTTGIENVTSGSNKKTLELQFVDAQTVVIKGMIENMPANLYRIDGKVVSADIERSNYQVTFHLNALPQGVYIIRIGQQSFKIFKKL